MGIKSILWPWGEIKRLHDIKSDDAIEREATNYHGGGIDF